MGCIRRAAAVIVFVAGLTVVAVGLAGWAQSPDVFPVGPGVTMVLGFIIALVGGVIGGKGGDAADT